MTDAQFKEMAKASVVHAVKACNDFLSPLGLTLSVNFEYDFQGFDPDAIGVYEDGSVFEGEISVGYNAEALLVAFKDEMETYPWSSEDKILDELASTTIYHEMGHGLCELISDYLENSDDLDAVYDANKELFDRVLDNEENAVEEFAWDMYDNDLRENDITKMVGLCLTAFSDVRP